MTDPHPAKWLTPLLDDVARRGPEKIVSSLYADDAILVVSGKQREPDAHTMMRLVLALSKKFERLQLAEGSQQKAAATTDYLQGTAFITGRHEFLLDPKDEFPEGFILR